MTSHPPNHYKRPTRRQLLVTIARLQHLIGTASMEHGNDRNPEGFDNGQRALAKAHAMCIDAAGYDNPVTERELARPPIPPNE